MFKMYIIVLSLVGLLQSGLAQIIQTGECDPSIQLENGFQYTSLAGSWFEVRTTDPRRDCSSYEFSDDLNVTRIGLNENFGETLTGALAVGDAPNKMTIRWASDDEPRDFWVLSRPETAEFALIYECVNLSSNERSVSLWVLSKTEVIPTIGEFLLNNILLNNLNIQLTDVRLVPRTEDACYELPIITPGNPIILPGQCDDTIGVVQNFNVAAFAGLWHEVASYYSENSMNQCTRAEYIASGDVVNVINSQVINETLAVITGTARVVSTDGSARLRVSLNVANEIVEQDLYVLSTDYDNYAISYTCVNNVADNTKRVFSWILSRRRQLSESAQQAVNEAISSELVLNNMYYQPSNQSNEACFYLPDPIPGTPVVFRGSCEPNIEVVQNFDAARYMGTWHDIRSYPSVFQTGSCRNANYELSDVVNVLNTQVIDQTLDTMVGVAVPVSSDGSAKLEVTFPVAGTNLNITTDYWVLATDYDSFALVYTCVDIPQREDKQVWAWQLSRTKQLTPAAEQAINNAMADVNVLDQIYFEPVDQTPEQCFYFPEPEPGKPVVFPGQCDDTISAVPNFDLSRFSGIWNEIEAYPKEQQTGQCVNHNYTLGTGNTLNLQSSSVSDQFLQLTNGELSFASPIDNSAKLLIRLESGIEIPFWILSTDYDNYALAYSCENKGTDFRAIYSWKLSRTQELSPASNTSINNAMSDIVVLDNMYFEPIDQSDDACFFLPDLAPGEPVILVGQCDRNIAVVENFEPARYLNRWHLIESYASDFQFGECNDATYSLNPNGTVRVFNTEVVNQTLATIEGYAEIDGNAKLLVYFPTADEASEYYVLDTDYDSYALVYSCRDLPNNQRQVWSWKMSRSRSLTPAAVEAINRKIDTVDVLNNKFYQEIDNSDEACFYFPDPNEPGPVRFRGRCDQTIQPVQNFNVAAYSGLWHNIELYPSVFQGGSCSNAQYSLGDEGVDVFNTQVIGQTLDTMTGLAVVASEDGSAKLNVTFPITGTDDFVTTNYWVLATDYDNYALVYTCEEINEEYRLVYSWKLSRTKQLSAVAVNAINAVTSQIQVLDDQYYDTVDQSPDGCFYFPEPEPGKPVIFPGTCDETISVVQDFDLERFAGMWNEIEAYPKEQQSGECVNHNYTLGTGNNILNLQSSSVLDQNLTVTNAVLSFASQTDISAKLLITLESGIQIPFWILSTDYENYALAYSCENRENDFRAIFSWKLSRTQELSPESNALINNAMSDVVVLENRYFEPINQSDDACFFLPDLAPGESVIIIGQCERNVAVIENFQPERYLGPWHLIESYPSDFQFGECNDATYSLNPNGTVRVFNTEVVDQTLVTIEGYAEIDGNAKLLVYFPTADEASEYYVLDTDYDSYALVYSCRDLPNNQRQVWSWKMSRSRSLTPAAVEAINRKIDTVDVLNNRFYQEIDNSDEACFYFPDPNEPGPVRFRGRCDQTIQPVQNFNVAAYLGLWHNIELYPSVFQGGSCSNARYSLGDEGVDVFNTQVIGQTLDTMSGLAVVASEDGSAKLNVTFPITGTDDFVTTNYWVLTTDYDNYALVYTCEEINEEYRLVYSWKLSRTKQLSPAAVNAINAVTSQIQVLDDQYYATVDQSPDGCFYFPEPEPGKPVVFPGTCDETISVVQDFDLERFQGIWHEIEAYPKEQQQDQCINHEYSLGTPNTLNLESTQVSNQSLTVYNGVLSFTSTDGSAMMTITITVDGSDITIPFWILNTDYDDYALAYSCVNLPEEKRGIYSWKLSRNRQLSNNAANSINSVMNTIDVLEQRYFEPIDQSDEACFYLPDLEPGDMVTFRGQCDESISGVPNFDVERYLGLWRTIETYPSEFQGGTCIQANYIAGDNGVIVANSQVFPNQTLDTLNGIATVGSTDGSGLLLVNFPTTPDVARYYVLATDYESYSLVYSCRNIGDDRRQVWAWKLSRDRTLSSAANSAINNVVNSINVLNDQYFENVEQSQQACFYYPEPNGEPVTFRGQCDENVAVVQNFNVAEYSGIWYDIESFPQNFQGGTCPIAMYTINGDVVDVYNTQVVDFELDEINAVAVPATDDGSAKLNVTFPVAGTDSTVTTPYWVLATDYDSYSLVYSCVNTGEDSYRVSSWKLSRQTTLSNEAAAAISAAQDNVKEFRQDYYEPQSHTEDDCFYYPDNNGGPVIISGQCENPNDVDVVPNFDPASFAGSWFEIEHFPSEFRNGDCVENELNSNEGGLSIIKRVIYGERLNTFNGQLSVASDNRGVLTVNLENGTTTLRGTIYVLDVDYNDYALLYGCRDVDEGRKQLYSWKLSRSQDGLSATANTNIDAIVSQRRYLAAKYYEPTGQDSNACFYYPVFEQRPSVISLPGSCDNSITAVPNFNAEAYLGRWFEISSYPDPNQFGTCSRAYYSLGNGVVDVTNTQVVNRTLLSQDGTAVVASTDGSGLLTVTFVVGGETRTASYYVLATDYTSYSLVYNCRNTDDGRREVFSWKLSRSNTISNEANTAIDTVIVTTQGLLEDYYETTSQTDEDCFFVPDFVPDQKLRFRGRCTDVTTGIQNFTPERYLKRWHEIERYPSDVDGGSCVSTVYESSGNTITFEGTRVFSINNGQVASGTATMNNNGRIERTYDDGTSEELWVMATDYDNYSLLLACEEVDDEFINVWSAKHSSTRAISSESQSALAPVIEENDFLYEDFFASVSQTDEACFYYPPPNGERVVLPGQCDPDIPTEEGFDLAGFTGTWYQIERYPYPEIRANSSCVGTRYTMRSDNELEVLNFENYDGDLNTIEGVATLTSNTSAVLSVTLRPHTDDEEATTTTDLYVLRTDYTSYAVLFTCENVDQYYRVVVAIKLSRSRELPDPAQEAITILMNSRQELDEQYFISVDHNDECRDPSSSYLIKSSIIMTLLCLIIQTLM